MKLTENSEEMNLTISNYEGNRNHTCILDLNCDTGNVHYNIIRNK